MKFILNGKELSGRELKREYASLREARGYNSETIEEDMAMATPMELGLYLANDNFVEVVEG